jgi:sec-independent protein translocase protein TatC
MELRARLIRVLVAVGVGFVFAAIFAKQIVIWLCIPIENFRNEHANVPREFRGTDLMEGFSTWIQVSLFAGLVLAMPWVLYQVWAFVRPGLKKEERGAVVPLVLGGTALFLGGVAVAYYFVAPAALNFLFAMNRMFGIEQATRLPKYVKLMTTLMLGFGAGFQLPLVMLILSWIGIVEVGFFRSRRKYALVLAFVFGAFLTPPDAPSQVIMAACLLVLYELGIVLSAIVDRRRARLYPDDEDDEDDEGEADGGGSEDDAGDGSAAVEQEGSDPESDEDDEEAEPEPESVPESDEEAEAERRARYEADADAEVEAESD